MTLINAASDLIARVVVWAVFDVLDRTLCRFTHRHP